MNKKILVSVLICLVLVGCYHNVPITSSDRVYNEFVAVQGTLLPLVQENKTKQFDEPIFSSFTQTVSSYNKARETLQLLEQANKLGIRSDKLKNRFDLEVRKALLDLQVLQNNRKVYP